MDWRLLFVASLSILLSGQMVIPPAAHLPAIHEGNGKIDPNPLQIQANVLREIPDTLIVLYRSGGLVKISGKRAEILNRDAIGKTLTLFQGKLYTGCRPIYEISMEGELLNRIHPNVPSCTSTVPLPGGRFAALDNENDAVYIINGAGEILASMNLTTKPNDVLQNMYGIVVENKLIVSEDGNSRIMSIDLETYEVTVLRDMSGVDEVWGPITYKDGTYYACSQVRVYRFTEDGPVEPAVEGIFDHAAGIGIASNRLYIAMGTGEIYMADLTTGKVGLVVTGLGRLRDMVVIPAVQPAQSTPTTPQHGTVTVMKVIKKRETIGYIKTGLLIIIFILAVAVLAIYLKGRKTQP